MGTRLEVGKAAAHTYLSGTTTRRLVCKTHLRDPNDTNDHFNYTLHLKKTPRMVDILDFHKQEKVGEGMAAFEFFPVFLF